MDSAFSELQKRHTENTELFVSAENIPKSHTNVVQILSSACLNPGFYYAYCV